MQPEIQAHTEPAPPITNETELEEILSRPPAALVDWCRRWPGDYVILGAGGKMGPSLAHLLRRAVEAAGVPRRIVAVSRFSEPQLPAQLEQWGVEVHRADLLEAEAVARLPEAPNVLYLVSRKFGTAGQQAFTWTLNTYVPATICQKYRTSRLVVMSTGNVYSLMPLDSGGSREEDPPRPIGEYAMSCLARERIVEHYSRSQGTPMAIVRLNYACELRYGVLVDLAQQVWANQPVNVEMPCFNVIWQRDANAAIIRALEHAAVPPCILNLTGPELIRVRDAALELGRRMGRTVSFAGREAETALLSNALKARTWFGPPEVPAGRLLDWIAHWVAHGGRVLGKPTKFQVRDGAF